MSEILAPCPGRVVPLADVPDPVFQAEMVGAGVALDPLAGGTAAGHEVGADGRVTVVSPLAGTVMQIHPHAFIVLGEGVGVLVHLGIDTVRLQGEGFETHVAKKDTVEAGQPMITWSPAAVAEQGLSPLIPVCVMDSPKGSIVSERLGEDVAAGDLLFSR